MSGELYDLALSTIWLCTPEALEALLSIAARTPLSEDEIARRMHGEKALALRGGQRREDSRRMLMDGPVAIIRIDGPIHRYADIFTMASGGVTTEALARDLDLALNDPQVSGILFAIDSPGGEAVGINELADTIYAARGRKPMIAYIEGYGASAAYWIASAADRVLVDDTAKVGSIGALIGVPDPSKRVSRTIDFVSSQSPKKRADPTTDEGRAYYQGLADKTAEVFISKVIRNREMDREAVVAVEGGLLTGADAVTAGLADALGSEELAIRTLMSGTLPVLRPARAWPIYLPVAARGTSARTQEERMKVSEFISGIFAGAKDAGIELEPDAPIAQTAQLAAVAAPLQLVQSKAADDERAAAVAAENAELRKQLAQVRAQQIQTEAQAFVKEQLGAGRAFPAEQAAIVALYVRAAEIDATAPRDDGQPSCAALVTAAYTERPASPMARQLIDGRPPTSAATVLTNNASQGDAEIAQADASAREYAKRANGKRAAS